MGDTRRSHWGRDLNWLQGLQVFWRVRRNSHLQVDVLHLGANVYGLSDPAVVGSAAARARHGFGLTGFPIGVLDELSVTGRFISARVASLLALRLLQLGNDLRRIGVCGEGRLYFSIGRHRSVLRQLRVE